jgi:hypothetical protein
MIINTKKEEENILFNYKIIVAKTKYSSGIIVFFI